jgi:hypothetical protein
MTYEPTQTMLDGAFASMRTSYLRAGLEALRVKVGDVLAQVDPELPPYIRDECVLSLVWETAGEESRSWLRYCKKV